MKKDKATDCLQFPATETKRVVLVGTYRGKQLTKWRGWYNYPVERGNEEWEMGNDKAACSQTLKTASEHQQNGRSGGFRPVEFSSVNELWLFKGTKDEQRFKAQFVGIKTREELIRDYKYLGEAENSKVSASQPSKPHAMHYALFKTELLYSHKLDMPEDVERVIIRVGDFAKRSPKIAKQLKAFLESPDRHDPELARRLPKIITSLRPEQFCVYDAAVQLSFWDLPALKALKPSVPFPPPAHPTFTFIDLFAGIGGFRLAMQKCGGECVFSSEIDTAAQKTYEVNFGDVPFGDITKNETQDAIPEKFDIVCAGFPCQAFSLAGKRRGFKDVYKGMSRGTLFAEVVKICERHRPKAVFCENVKGLYIHDKGNTFKIIKNEFESIGYHFFYKILNSKDFGVPQHRERIYMVAFREDYANDGYEFVFPEPTGCNKTLNDIREHNVSAKYYLSEVYVETLRRHRARHEAAGHGFGYVIRAWDGISGAIVCGGMGRETNLLKEEGGTPKGLVPETHIRGTINTEGIRKMTPREWARLQGFPEEFKLVLSDVHLYKQFGNSVSIPVVEAISKRIISRIEEIDKGK